ncbi:MAG: lysoplasmalogenase [Chitinophagales bacterium]|nr:lysoplasmalogenase [Chitinophagales bacterium]
MQLLKKNGLILFWALLLVDCFFIFTEQNDYHTYLKPLLIPVLFFYLILNAKKKKYKVSKLLISLGLLCSWIGDILLLVEGEKFLIAGTIAFVATYIFYSIFFFRVRPINNSRSYETVIITTIVAIGIIFSMYNFLKDGIPSYFKFPFFISAIAISVMFVLASNLYSDRKRRKLAFQYFIPGALLFIISEASLATHLFKYTEESFINVIVMITYGYAQNFMVQGFVKYLKS